MVGAMILDPGVLLILAMLAFIAGVPIIFGPGNNWLHSKKPPEIKD